MGQALRYRYRICEVLVSWERDVGFGGGLKDVQRNVEGGRMNAVENVYCQWYWRVSRRGRARSLKLGRAFRALDSLLPRLWVCAWSKIFNNGFRRLVSIVLDSSFEHALESGFSFALLHVRSRYSVGLPIWCAVISFDQPAVCL